MWQTTLKDYNVYISETSAQSFNLEKLQVCEEKKWYKFENPQNKFYFWPLLFSIWISWLMYACISVSNREKNLNHWGHLIDRRCLVII